MPFSQKTPLEKQTNKQTNKQKIKPWYPDYCQKPAVTAAVEIENVEEVGGEDGS